MLIKKSNHLNEEMIKEIRQVESICKQHDKLNGDIFLDTSMNFNPKINSIFMLYQDDKLAGVISVFIPTSQEAEISAYTLPECRQRGYFKRLLQEVEKEMQEYNIPDLLFVCQPQSIGGKAAVNRLGGKLAFTEYFLRYQGLPGDAGPKQAEGTGIKLQKAELKDLEAIISLSQEVFNDSYEDAKSLITNTLEADNRIQYNALLGEKLIGMASIGFENEEVSIYGVGVSPKYQGKGYGKALIKLMLEELKNREAKSITIEVDSSNEKALNLYKKCGFKVETAFDYYRKKI